MIEIYTDGSCLSNPGPGGWAAIVLQDGSKRELHGGEKDTTNNRMEILAVIKGLEALPESSEVTIFSDSQYVVSTMTRNWKRNANKDLWDRLDAETGKRKVKWQWVRAHVGNPLNEEADRLAVQEAKRIENGGSTERPANEAVEVSASQRANAGETVVATRQAAATERASLTHIDESGEARMVDVGWKQDTERVAVAKGAIVMKPETLALIKSNGFEKGDVLGVARIAGVMGAKSTSQLIPLCHPIPLDKVDVEFELDDERSAVNITGTAKTTGKTGVEMEAMTAVSIAALTIYDMCKAVDRAMRIEGVRLVRKSGGKSGDIVLE